MRTGPVFAPDGVGHLGGGAAVLPEIERRGRLEAAVFESVAALGTRARGWDRLVRATGADICFTTPWLETWAAHYGAGHCGGRALRLILVTDAAGQAVAALPFVLTRHRWPHRLTVATWMGAQETIAVFRPPIRPGREKAALALALERLFADGPGTADAVSLSPLSGENTRLADAARALAGEGAAALAVDTAAGPHTVFAVPESRDAWLAGLDKRRRQNWRRDLRLAETHAGIAAAVARGADAPAAFERFAALHTAQWRAAGLPGHFGDWPGALAFNRALAARFSAPDAPGTAEIHEIRGRDGALLASQYVFRCGASAAWRLPARAPDEAAARLGLGRLGLGLMIGALAGSGVTRIEAGPGHYPYKLDHGAAEHTLRRLVLTPPGAGPAAARLAAWARAVHLGYHRLWYARGALRLARVTGRPRPAVAKAWISTRL